MAKQAGKGVAEFRPYVTRVIPVGANIVCADNTGAKIVLTIRVFGGSGKKYGRVGDIIKATIKDAVPNANVTLSVAVGTRVPLVSRSSTVISGAIVTPATALVGS